MCNTPFVSLAFAHDPQAANAAHEIGHALGFNHEQKRPDRDKYIEIVFGNIQPEETAVHQFQLYQNIDYMDAVYDLGSIMHYGPTVGGISFCSTKHDFFPAKEQTSAHTASAGIHDRRKQAHYQHARRQLRLYDRPAHAPLVHRCQADKQIVLQRQVYSHR